VPLTSAHCHCLLPDTGKPVPTGYKQSLKPEQLGTSVSQDIFFVTASLAKFKKDNHTPGVMRNHYLTRVRYAKLSKVSAINHFTVTVKLV